MDTTFEEARRCPKCEKPGKEVGSRVGPFGSTIHTIMCANSRCEWSNTTYLVQVKSDGKVVEPTLEREKSFPKLEDRTERVQAQMQRLYEQSLNSDEI